MKKFKDYNDFINKGRPTWKVQELKDYVKTLTPNDVVTYEYGLIEWIRSRKVTGEDRNFINRYWDIPEHLYSEAENVVFVKYGFGSDYRKREKFEAKATKFMNDFAVDAPEGRNHFAFLRGLMNMKDLADMTIKPRHKIKEGKDTFLLCDAFREAFQPLPDYGHDKAALVLTKIFEVDRVMSTMINYLKHRRRTF